jgi:hydrogenase maturation protease
MSQQKSAAPVLIFTYGNPSRGDDALGPAMFDLLERKQKMAHTASPVELLTEYQLQIEHTIDLEQRECVLFIDASASCPSPYEFYKLQAEQDDSYTTHAMSPAALLAVYQKINQREPPPSYMIAIRGYEFDLGQTITEQAMVNFRQSYEFIETLLGTGSESWPEVCASGNNRPDRGANYEY